MSGPRRLLRFINLLLIFAFLQGFERSPELIEYKQTQQSKQRVLERGITLLDIAVGQKQCDYRECREKDLDRNNDGNKDYRNNSGQVRVYEIYFYFEIDKYDALGKDDKLAKLQDYRSYLSAVSPGVRNSNIEDIRRGVKAQSYSPLPCEVGQFLENVEVMIDKVDEISLNRQVKVLSPELRLLYNFGTFFVTDPFGVSFSRNIQAGAEISIEQLQTRFKYLRGDVVYSFSERLSDFNQIVLAGGMDAVLVDQGPTLYAIAGRFNVEINADIVMREHGGKLASPIDSVLTGSKESAQYRIKMLQVGVGLKTFWSWLKSHVQDGRSVFEKSLDDGSDVCTNVEENDNPYSLIYGIPNLAAGYVVHLRDYLAASN
jgi:hypothetical protein